MLVKLCVFALVVALAAAQNANGCTSCSSVTDCYAGGFDACCSGTCKLNKDLVALGGTCSSTACCQTGFTCDGTSSKCVLNPGVGYGCSCSSAACYSGLTCNTGSTCGYTGIGVGGNCNSFNLCASGLTCSSSTASFGTCTAIGVNDFCQRTGTNILGAALDGSNCMTGLYCNATSTVSGQNQGKCFTLIAQDQPIPDVLQPRCLADGSSNVCASAYCSYATTGNGKYCRATGFQANGGNCTLNSQCSSGLCNTIPSTTGVNTCIAKNTYLQGQRCQYTGASSGLECQTGFCSVNSTTGATVSSECVSGTYQGGAPGATCYNDDQCQTTSSTSGVPAHACVKTDNNYNYMHTGVCNATVANTACTYNAAFGTQCQSNGASYTCKCSSTGVQTCQAVTSGTVGCPTQTTALSALATMYPNAGTAYFPAMILAIGTSDQQMTAVKYSCCQACVNYGITNLLTVNGAYTASQYTDKVPVCSSNTVGSYSASDATARCNSGRSAVTGASLGSCPASPGAGVSVVPSVALLAAILAVLITLLA